MANTLKFGNGIWATKKGSTLAYNDENGNFKPLPFTFDRSTSATRVNKEGLIEVVSNNEPRIDFKDSSEGALLLEPSRTNLIPSNVSDWVVFQSNVTQSNQSPDGYNNAIKITSNAVVNSGVYFSGLSVSGNTEIFTIWLKGENGGEILEIGDATNRTTVTLTNEWVRYEAKVTSASAFKILYNQTTNPIVQTWYAWGPQLEDNVSYATSYIPTQGSIGTRVAESCNDAGNDQVINSTEGVLYAEIKGFENDAISRAISISNGTTLNRINLFFSSNQSQVIGRVNAGSSTPSADMIYTGINQTTFNKIAVKWKVNDFALWVNGIEVLTDLNGAVPSGLNVISFDNASSAVFLGNCKDVRVYNTALTDQELINLTTI